MFGENKNLKDSSTKNTDITIKDTSLFISYTKADKLITALYMVTDIISEQEPLRNKLRTLGIEIISDIHLIEQNNIGHLASTIHTKVSQVMSFLELAFTINIVSEMNYSILRKEFLELNQSLKESTGKAGITDRKIDLSEFFENSLGKKLYPHPTSPYSRGRSKEGVMSLNGGQDDSKGHLIGHQKFTRIGVQKGSTLMRALKDMNLADVGRPKFGRPTSVTHANNFDILKKQRRDDIINIIKLVGGNATIKDIRDEVQISIGQASSLTSCGEKTLQRELISMVKDGVLNKTGEKRWSRYFLK